MTISPTTKAYFQIHIAVILFGFTAILGDLIELPALVLVWWRVLITSFSLIFFLKLSFFRYLFKTKLTLHLAGIGILVGLHWLCFYGSVKLANASIALICMATTSIFTSIVEPLIVKSKFKIEELILAILIIPCIVLVVNHTPPQHYSGVIVGLLAALLAALFSVLNKKHVHKIDAYKLTFIELSSAWLFLSIVLIFMFSFSKFELNSFVPTSPIQWLYVLILALGCTTLAFILSIKALHHISAFASNMVINLEPVYGIFLAIIILKEHKELNVYFYIGATMISLIVILYPFITKYFHTKYARSIS